MIAPFIVQKSPNYCYSLEPQNHIAFNSSQIFETHPSSSQVKISIDSLAAVASFQRVPKYISKVKVMSKNFTLKQLFPWKMGAKGQISLMQIFNGDRPIVQLGTLGL